ncbi:hypothetical protein K435DRAFT_899220 [Dendrothele bispora CBS 962.96]|uniref:No apical meristem-associated C-terminal domain-containing protein n=1 Tax=Dendrothele bispora (strain CBS 962.96) TaxID=1314807 RepID=A0A4S8KLY3_DENBC|nr:hypothetical protein K435DRAFT_899220 [Dendrothele bispora CBS 962.96]
MSDEEVKECWKVIQEEVWSFDKRVGSFEHCQQLFTKYCSSPARWTYRIIRKQSELETRRGKVSTGIIREEDEEVLQASKPPVNVTERVTRKNSGGSRKEGRKERRVQKESDRGSLVGSLDGSDLSLAFCNALGKEKCRLRQKRRTSVNSTLLEESRERAKKSADLDGVNKQDTT